MEDEEGGKKQIGRVLRKLSRHHSKKQSLRETLKRAVEVSQ